LLTEGADDVEERVPEPEEHEGCLDKIMSSAEAIESLQEQGDEEH
jgi:hypothetical protein